MSLLAAAPVALHAQPANRAPNSLSEAHPQADPRAIVTVGNARFTVLTPALLRLEWSASKTFEDRPTFAVINRKLSVPEFNTSTHSDGVFELSTAELRLTYNPAQGAFSPENLRIERLNPPVAIWHPGAPATGNLLGTVRTLDSVSGSIPLPNGLLSRDGWSLLDDSGKWVFDTSEWPWAAARQDPQALDWYFFGQGLAYRDALRDFTRISGAIPLPPRYMLGAWWSRYWPYSADEFRQLVAEYEQHDVPLDVLVVDMDWHLPGWTGYTFDPKYFPDPAGFLEWTARQGLRTTFNLHPHDGVGKHEAAFADVARAVGEDPSKVDRIPFQAWNRKYIAAYFKYLHHPLERMGVDFWWMDWQQGTDSGLAGLDPLTWLNYLHWTDWERNPSRENLRPVIFSRWGGTGNHRYQIGFSGDTYCNWESLAFQPYFTATAGNVGYAWWSHDIGGHQPGVVDPELYARWIQWGALSPALRTHTTRNPNAERRLWAFADDIFKTTRDAFRLRYALAPYIYSAGRQTHDTGLPLVRPLYLFHEREDNAYTFKNEYFFGNDLLVAPVVTPRDPLSQLAFMDVWFPPGEWVDWFTGEVHTGPAVARLDVPLNHIPLFVRAGAIIPTAPVRARLGNTPFEHILWNIFPGRSEGALGQLYEDDTIGRGYLKQEFATTQARWRRTPAGLEFSIDPAQGQYNGQPAQRTHELVVHDVARPTAVRVNGTPSANWHYDPLTFRLGVPVLHVAKSDRTEINIDLPRNNDAELLAGARGRLNDGLTLAHRCHLPIPPEWFDQSLDYMDAVSNPAAAHLRASPAGPAPHVDVHALLHADWAARLLARPDADSTATLRALAGLVGLEAQTVVTLDEGTSGFLHLETRIGLQRPLPGLRAEVHYAISPPWRIAGEPSAQPVALEPGQPLRWKLQALPERDLTSALLDIDYRFTLNGAHFSTSQSLPLFPSIPAWHITGPFDNAPEGIALDKAYSPEQRPVKLDDTFEGIGGAKLKWREVRMEPVEMKSIGGEYKVDLRVELQAPEENRLAYAVTWIDSPAPREAILLLASDDGVMARLNGREVWRNPVGRPYLEKQDRVPIQLKAGRNELLLKISQGSAGWEFAAWIEDVNGNPMRDISYSTRP